MPESATPESAAPESATPAAAGRDEPGDTLHARNLGRLAATVERLQEEVRRAHATADGRALVEMAKGVLIERLQCGPAEAAQQLTVLAEAANVSELELAADIIDQAARDRLSEVARDFLARVRAADGTGDGTADGAGDGTGHAAVARSAAGPVAVRLRTAESGALAAPDSQTVISAVFEHALTPLGAKAAAVWTPGPGSSLLLAGQAGFAAAEAENWHHVPPGVTTPARQALDRREVVWITSLSEVGMPSIGHRRLSEGGRAAVPAEVNGRMLGVLEICWAGPLPPQPPQIERQVRALGELVARTLDSRPSRGPDPGPGGSGPPEAAELIELADGLHDPALVLLPHLGPDGQLIDFRIHHVNARFADPAGRSRDALTGSLLLETYPMAAEEGGLHEKVEHVHATGEPFRATGMALPAVVGQVRVPTKADVSITRFGVCVLLVWRQEDDTARLTSLLQHAQRLGRIGGFEENYVTGTVAWNSQLYDLYGLAPAAAPVPLEELPSRVHSDDALDIGRFLRTLYHHRRAASGVFRLLRSDRSVRHVRIVAEPELDQDRRLVAIRGAYQDISAQHWAEVALSATRDQLAHSQEQTAAHNRLARQLQQVIMPTAYNPVDSSDLRIAVRYRPAEDEHLVGGDWYDAIVLPSDRVLVAVGDVAGHGIAAATGMVALRNALRGLAATGAGPGQILSWLNLVTYHFTEQVTATAVCGLFDPGERTFRWARAGHLPPVVVRRDHAHHAEVIKGPLLGAVQDAEYEEGQLRLEADDVLILYTDGLIERRDTSLQETLDHLLTLARKPAGTLDQRLDHLLTHSGADTDDDTCIVGIHVK